MEFLNIFVILYSIFVCQAARLCTNEDCTGKPDRRTGTKECTVEDVPDEGKIVSLEIIDQRRKSRCISGKNYGFYTRSVWISRKCEADFRVCFVTDVEDDITTVATNSTSPTTITQSPLRVTIPDLDDVPTYPMRKNPTTYGGFKTKIFHTTTENPGEDHQRQVIVITPSILGGIVGALLFVIMIVVIVVVIVKRCKYSKRKSDENTFHLSTGHHPSITSTVSQLTTLSNDDTYDSLEMYREHHPYKVCDQPQPHTYTTIYDTINDISNRDQEHTGYGGNDHETQSDDNTSKMADGFIGEYIDLSSKAEVDKNDKDKKQNYTKEFIKENNKTSTNKNTEGQQYNVLDPLETGFYKGTQSLEISEGEKSSNIKSDRYVDLSLRNSCQIDNEECKQYNILDSSETGFHKGIPSEVQVKKDNIVGDNGFLYDLAQSIKESDQDLGN